MQFIFRSLFFLSLVFPSGSYGQTGYCCCDMDEHGNYIQCLPGDNKCCKSHPGHKTPTPFPVCGSMDKTGDIRDCHNLPYCCCDIKHGRIVQCLPGDNKCCKSHSEHKTPVTDWNPAGACRGVNMSGDAAQCAKRTK